MKTEIVTVNRTPVWVSFNYHTVKNTVTGSLHNFIECYYKLSEPRNGDFGKLLTKSKEEALLYSHIDEAKSSICHILKSVIYPPDFLHPLEYTIENIEEIMNKELVIETGDIESEESEYSFVGIISQCSFAGNPAYLPVAAKIRLENNDEIICNFFQLKKISKS